MLAVPLLLSTGCSMGYLWHLGVGQARILIGMESVEKTLKQEEIPPSLREKILLLQQTRSFG